MSNIPLNIVQFKAHYESVSRDQRVKRIGREQYSQYRTALRNRLAINPIYLRYVRVLKSVTFPRGRIGPVVYPDWYIHYYIFVILRKMLL
jgi:hypothetical protein